MSGGRASTELNEPVSETLSESIPYRAGQVIGDKFEILRLLGQGGMGCVLEARHLQLEKSVALKILLPEYVKRDEWVARFMREARAAANVAGENVVQIMDVSTIDGVTPYIVMEYLDGIDLAKLVELAGPLSVELAVAYTLQACRALVEAHALGIVHRDLKPANLFLTKRVDGTDLVKVLDFGISKMSQESMEHARGALTSTHGTMGSPFYMSPEQLRSAHHVDSRSDIWSLGIVLHELLAGAPPFQGESLSSVCAAVVGDPPIPVRHFNPEVPLPLEQIILRCLEKEPARRFPDVQELMTALQALLPGPPPLRRAGQSHAPKETRSRSVVRATGPFGESTTGVAESALHYGKTLSEKPAGQPIELDLERSGHYLERSGHYYDPSGPPRPLRPPSVPYYQHPSPEVSVPPPAHRTLQWVGVVLVFLLAVAGLLYAGYGVFKNSADKEMPTEPSAG